MEYFNAEGNKLRIKDKIWYYRNEKGKLVETPKMTDDKETVFAFLRLCVLRSMKNVTDEEIEEAWTEAEQKNELILAGLQQMKDEAEASGENTYKVVAYVRAIKAIKAIKVPILSGKQAEKLSNIGKGIASVIDEILRSGRLKTQEERIEAMASRQPIVDRFLGIWGVTAKLASQWYNKGYKELEDLTEEKLTNKQKLGIKYYDDLQKKITRETVEKFTEKAQIVLGTKVEAVGPYRAGEKEVNVIEILVYSEKSGKTALQKIVNKLDPLLADSEDSELKPTKFSGICNVSGVYHRIDIHLIPESEIGVFLLFSTGPKSFIDNLKQQASVLDYRLDKKGLVKVSVDNEEKIDTPNEKSIFETIGIDYVEPQNRA